jgi:hypothetical protein
MQNLCIGHECSILVYRTWENGFTPNASIVLLWTQNDVWECFGTFAILSHVKRCKTCVPSVNALFRGTEVAKNHCPPNASILIPWTYIDVWECFGAFWKPSESKNEAKLVFHYFGCTAVAKMVSHQMPQLYCLGPKMSFGSVLEHFIKLLRMK